MKQLAATLVFALTLGFIHVGFAAGGNRVPLEHARINVHDKASLQRGAKLYMNYCASCHALKYLRYNRMAADIGIVMDGKVAKKLLKNNLIFTGAKVSAPIRTAMTATDAKRWFGVKPPDLTLIARIRGPDWLYTYLRSFYNDPAKPWGVNNSVFPDVAMPNVLLALQGMQIPRYREEVKVVGGVSRKTKVVDHLVLVSHGSMTTHEFDSAINDLVNFLVYASEPVKSTRVWLGIFVVIFLLIFTFLAYLLKKEYWRDVK